MYSLDETQCHIKEKGEKQNEKDYSGITMHSNNN